MGERRGVLLDLSAELDASQNAKLEKRNGVLGWRRPQLSPAKIRKRRELATALHELLGRAHDIYTYSELGAEKAGGNIGVDWHPAGNYLHEVQLRNAREPISRAKVMGCLSIEQFATRENVIAFVRRLLDPSDFWRKEGFSEFERANAAGRDRLRSICAGLNDVMYPDALHLWAAEVNELAYFLTMDAKFRNVMTKTKRILLPCKPVCPDDILSEFGVETLVPVPTLDDGHWHSYYEGCP